MNHSQDDATMAYADIIHLPHHQSTKHPAMSMHDRAAQFGSFAALTGHYDAIVERARHTEQQIQLCEDERQQIENQLSTIIQQASNHPTATLIYFVPDELKDGGEYREYSGQILKYDELSHMLTLDNGIEIPLSHIILCKDCANRAQ